MESIKSEVVLLAPVDKVWSYFTDPKHVTKWFFVLQNQKCQSAVVELKEGGEFRYLMSTREAGTGYEFRGKIENILAHEKIELILHDGREAAFYFDSIDATTTKFTMVFEPETKNTSQTQKRFWDVVLTNFEKYVEK